MEWGGCDTLNHLENVLGDLINSPMIPEPNFSALGISFLAVVFGLVMLVAGGEALVSGASRFAIQHGMRPMVVGLTIVAFGTSMPELFVSLNAALQNHPDIMIGNVVGSNVANIGMVLAIAALISPLPVRFKAIRKELFIVLGVSLLLPVIGAIGFFYRIFGMVLVGGLIWYTVSAVRRGDGESDRKSLQEELVERQSMLRIVGLQGFGLLLLGYGSDLFIDGAVDVANRLGVSELIVGLTVAAVGTSLPELASSISAIRRKENDILIGNVVGSNMFNLMMVLGGTAVIRPFGLSPDLLARDLPVMIGFIAVLTAVLFFCQRLSRFSGLVLLAAYVSYIWLLS